MIFSITGNEMLKILLLLVTVATSISIDVPTSLSVNESLTTDSSISVTWVEVDDVIGYDIRYGPLHNTSEHFTISTNSTTYLIDGLESNRNYVFQVRSKNATAASEYSNSVISRTAPDGARIMNSISAPHHITVLLEETRGATQWQIRYVNTNGSWEVVAPTAGNSSLSFYYLATLTDLLPNTVYQVQNRISQVFGTINYTESQSPYGDAVNITTERISFFGKGVLNRTYEDGNTTKVENILREVYNQTELHEVVVHRLANSSGLVWCFHEIIINDEAAPNISAVTNLVSSQFQELQLFNAQHDELGYFMEENPPELRLNLINQTDGMKPAGNQQCQFTIINKSEFINETNIQVDHTERESIAIIFDNQEISFELRSDGDTLAGNTIQLPADEIFMIRQNYLFETTDGGGRIYGSDLGDPVKGSDYSIIHTTSSENFVFETLQITDEDSNKTVLIFSPPADRLTRILFTYGNITNSFLTERYMDSSTLYQVELDSLEELNEISVDVSAFIRTADGNEIMRTSTFNISKCLPRYDTVVNGEVECNNGNFIDSNCTFTCSDEYILNGESSITCLNDFNWSSSPPTCEVSLSYDGVSSTDDCKNQSEGASTGRCAGKSITWVWVILVAVFLFHIIFNSSVYCSRMYKKYKVYENEQRNNVRDFNEENLHL